MKLKAITKIKPKVKHECGHLTTRGTECTHNCNYMFTWVTGLSKIENTYHCRQYAQDMALKLLPELLSDIEELKIRHKPVHGDIGLSREDIEFLLEFQPSAFKNFPVIQDLRNKLAIDN